jgi:hypothetical protein
MMKTENNMKKMCRNLLLIITVISMFAISCSTRKNKVDRNGLIPEKEIVSLLTDLYIADGLLMLPGVRNEYSELDSNTVYIQIIEKHGYTKARMDQTMKYYFIKNPQKLIKMYDQVLGALSEMESRAQNEAALMIESVTNLWPGKKKSYYPGYDDNDSSFFSLALARPGKYTVSLTATLFPDDQSVNQGLTLWTSNPDSLETGRKQYIRSIDYIKDGMPHRYQTDVVVPEKVLMVLRGTLFEYTGISPECEKHAVFENISIVFSSQSI